ncbi:sensor histidine kinase [Pseudogemmobacter humi]|uniref:histidine kinase n=1 Tax=Pseudogemmobacter humi TaxID=2483812 RepID=A0A3P5WUA0_9RHOB|nr:cache domain-containing protein [Pseudogemmobacter humi]VDC25158.1 Sensor protein FixL [Pseudogemmobacter humi]
MRFSLRILLACCLAGLQFLAVLTVVFSSYFTSERALIAHARDLLRDVGTNAIEHSKGFLNPAQGAAELAARLAQNRVVASEDHVQLEQLLFQQLQITPQFAGVYYGSEEGNFVMVMRTEDAQAPFRSKIIRNEGGARSIELIWRNDDFSVVAREQTPEDPYDPRNRPWYLRAKSDLTTIWTDPYIFFTSQQPGITLAAPVVDAESGVKGVVGVDIEISKISDFLSRLKIGVQGKALIIHRNGDVIAHPDLDLIKITREDGTLRFANIAEFEDPIARAAFAGHAGRGPVLVDQVTASQFTWDGEVYVSTVMPPISDKLPWTIGVYAPEDDFTAVIKQNRTANIWIAALVAAISGVIGLALADYIHRPVRAFAVRSTLISQGELDPTGPAPRTYKELERANATLMQQILARRDAEREYGQTFDLSSRAMAQISPKDGAVIRANAKFAELIGAASPADVVGCRIADIAHPGDLAQSACADSGPGGAETSCEMRWYRRDGAMIHVSLNSIVIRDDQGRPLHGVLMVDDITRDKAREGQIAQLNRDLSHLARGNTMGQMAAGLAHELNQPLAAIAQNADTALLTLGEGADPELRELLDEIERQSLRAGDIIRALRSFIRKDEGTRHPFDFADLLDQAQRLVHPEATEAGVRIVTLTVGLPQVTGNHIHVAQVIVNLLRNAIEAIAPEPENERLITIHATREGDLVRVCVQDSGPGIRDGINLFTQFETSKPDGMGLGLSICRALVEANGGQLWHEKPAGRGARFCFTLPVAAAAAAA